MRTDEACRPPASSFCPPGKLALQLTNPLSPSIAAHRPPKPRLLSIHTPLQRPLAHLLLLFSVVSGGVRTAAAAASERTDGRTPERGNARKRGGSDFVLALPFRGARARPARLCQPSAAPMGGRNSPSAASRWPVAAEDAVDVAPLASRRNAETRREGAGSRRRIDERGREEEKRGRKGESPLSLSGLELVKKKRKEREESGEKSRRGNYGLISCRSQSEQGRERAAKEER